MDFRNQKYTIQGVANLNVQEELKTRNLTKTDQLLHVLGVALVQTPGLKKGQKIFGTEGKNATQKEM